MKQSSKQAQIMKTIVVSLLALVFFIATSYAQSDKPAVIAYYAGRIEPLDTFDVSRLTHIIYCFGHLQGNRLHLNRARDTAMIQKMVALKGKNPDLKVLLSLGGWGGCAPCSDVFSSKNGRREFAQSVKELTNFFGSDGVDLDWEYPTVPGYPGHKYAPEDKKNFTALVKELRETLGKNKIVSFAAGAKQRHLEGSVDWKRVMKHVDFVNLMTYDLVGGYATKTGHHTALHNTPQQSESTDNCVQYLLGKGINPRKLIIGAAFYARIFENVPEENQGLYQPGKFKTSVGFKDFSTKLSKEQGFEWFWDDVAKAPYAYNRTLKQFATFDDKQSVAEKTRYLLEKKLGGIMFWHLGHDIFSDGLLHTISQTLRP